MRKNLREQWGTRTLEEVRAYYRNYMKNYRKTHLNYNKKNREYQRNLWIKLRLEIIELLGGKCSNPYNIEHGTFLTDVRCLQIDHVKGGGCKKSASKTIRDYIRTIREIKSGSKDYQLLCANCNWIKRREKHEYRKRLEEES